MAPHAREEPSLTVLCKHFPSLLLTHTSPHHTLLPAPKHAQPLPFGLIIFFFFPLNCKDFCFNSFPKSCLDSLPRALSCNKRSVFISRSLAHRKPSFSASDFRNCRGAGMSGGTWSPICHHPEVTRQLSVLSTPSPAPRPSPSLRFPGLHFHIH